MQMSRIVLPGALLLILAQTCNAEPVVRPLAGKSTAPLQGANALLQQLEPKKTEQEPALTPKKDAVAILRGDLEAFGKQAANLPSDEAAKRWLALADRYVAWRSKTKRPGPLENPLSFSDVVAVLPPPASWQPLARAVAARRPLHTRSQRDLVFMLLAHALTGNKAEGMKDLRFLRASLTAQSANDLGDGDMYSTAQHLAVVVTQFWGDPKQILHATMTGLRPTGSKPPRPRRAGTAEKSRGVVLPDLVSLQGSAKSQAQLRNLLLTTNAEIAIPLGNETRRMAQGLARQLVGKMKVPQWKLAQAIDTTQLFEAMEKRFPKTPRTSSYRLARTYYLLGLVAESRMNDALALVNRLGRNGTGNIPPEALSALDRAGHSQNLNSFLHRLLNTHPDLPYWGVYITTAARVGRTADMLALLHKAAARKNLKPLRVYQLRETLYRALLAANRVNDGIAVLRQLLVAKPPAGSSPNRLEMAVTLARVGYLTNHNNWTTEGVKIVRASLKDASPYRTYSPYQDSPIDLLIEVGRDAEAEKELGAILEQQNAQKAEKAILAYMQPTAGTWALTRLAGIYERRGRHQDVIALLDKAPWWGAKDLSRILHSPDVTGTPLGYMAASSLAATGQREKAIEILHALLRESGAYDPAYRLLTDLQGAEAIPFLDELFSRDRFEERPLIWKARLLLNEKRLQEAEAIARQAIAIDPSDGEQGKGDRMRVYAVLADILQARGDNNQAEAMRGAVRAIRLSEKADDFYAAGLLTGAINMYQQALTYFADAYCIQSRLAVQLAARGRLAEAEAHYRRAYELMPDSFGRLESHCFGCEGAFSGYQASTLAETVFRQLLVKNPNKPQLHYLLGYLRDEQDRPREALVHYRRAVQLDRDYINAWNKLLETGQSTLLPAADRDAAIYNLLRLDPLQKHARLDLRQAGNLRRLWEALAVSVQKQPPPTPAELYPLPASKPLAEQQEQEIKKELEKYGISDSDKYLSSIYEVDEDGETSSWNRFSPSEIIAQHSVVTALGAVIDGEAVYDRYY